MAVNYLKNHFYDTVGLIYESEDPGNRKINRYVYKYTQIYWIYSDNFIATWALNSFDPQMSSIINHTIQSYNLPSSGLFEVLFGKPIPENISIAIQLVVEQHPDRVIMAEFHNSSQECIHSSEPINKCY